MTDDRPTTNDPDWPPVCEGCGQRHVTKDHIEEILAGFRRAVDLPPPVQVELGWVEVYAIAGALADEMHEAVEGERYELAEGWKKILDYITETAQHGAAKEGAMHTNERNGNGE